MVPVVQPGQVDAAAGVHVPALPHHHGGRGPQQADGRREGEGVQQPQQDGEVVGPPCTPRE